MNDINKWIKSWVEIYPEDAMFNNRKLRSDAEYCIKKMQKFCKDNPQYTKEIIFAATKQYMTEQQYKDFAYTKQAVYFISKQGEPSLLKEYCQRIILGEVKSQPPVVYLYDESDWYI